MRRKIVLFIIIAICFLLQTTVFRALTFANIGPNLLIIVVSSFGLMRGKKKGCGLDSFVDCLSTYFWVLSRRICFTLYVHRLHQRIVQKRFYPDDIKLPMILIGSSDIVNNLMIYIVMFLCAAGFLSGIILHPSYCRNLFIPW